MVVVAPPVAVVEARAAAAVEAWAAAANAVPALAALAAVCRPTGAVLVERRWDLTVVAVPRVDRWPRHMVPDLVPAAPVALGLAEHVPVRQAALGLERLVERDPERRALKGLAAHVRVQEQQAPAARQHDLVQRRPEQVRRVQVFGPVPVSRVRVMECDPV